MTRENDISLNMLQLARVNTFLHSITSRREWIFSILWRAAVIFLPWQTRFFSGTPLIDGYPWEQGRLSVYVSWFLLLSVILLGRGWMVFSAHAAGTFRERKHMWWGVVLLALPAIFSLFPRASVQWWMQMLILFFFFCALAVQRVHPISVARWFVVSLVPHVLVGQYQFFVQGVFGFKWLGMAAQDPLRAGVAVLLVNGVRILRVYGGFPHPNIFGGWLALALCFVSWIVARSRGKLETMGWMGLAIAYSVTLILTFSRGAWIAVILGLLFIFCKTLLSLRKPGSGRIQRNVFLMLVVIAISLGVAAWQERGLITTRVQIESSLEQRSLDERVSGWREGLRVALAHPIVGVGPGAMGYVLQSQQLPHSVPLLVLGEMGISGIAGISLLLLLWRSRRIKEPILSPPIRFWAPVVCLLMLGFFDHFLWSLWAGQILAFFALYSLYF